jgi:VWFA-related protein
MPIETDHHPLLLLCIGVAVAALLSAQCASLVCAQSGRRLTRQAAETRTDKEIGDLTIRTTEVSLNVTVRDSLGRAVEGLKADDFFIYDNGRRYEALRFERQRGPINLVLLLDAANDVFDDAETINQSLLAFRRALAPADRLAVMRFSDEIELIQDWCGDEASLLRGLRTRPRASSGRAAIYDAVMLAAAKLSERDGQRAIILLTGGLNTAGSANAGDALATLQNTTAALYTFTQTEVIASLITATASERWQRMRNRNIPAPSRDVGEVAAALIAIDKSERELARLAEQSGGSIYFPLRESSLRWMLAQTAEELRAQYVVTYQPQNEDDWSSQLHRIEVLVRDGHRAYVRVGRSRLSSGSHFH